ncbi:unnamed protein product [Candida verbasci]|uniref:Mug135-like C-terminal domain-containing protein n=1 Tax=Candida verbasci TaxID=1227364 RepID=A0A9W4TT02_9ASCO|nr:unnamed protein product [Candida verbasci]
MKLLAHIKVNFKKNRCQRPENDYITTTTTTTTTTLKQDSDISINSLTTTNNKKHKRNSSIIFPDGTSSHFYGLPSINKLNDIDNLRRFEVIRYLEGFNIGYNYDLSDIDLKSILKDIFRIEKG